MFRLLVADMDASQEEPIKLLLERASSPNKYYLKGKLNGLVMYQQLADLAFSMYHIPSNIQL